MNENKGIRIWQRAVLLLVLCNIGLILTIWLKPKQESGPPHGETPRDFVIRSLKFNNDQIAKYDVLVKEHQQAMRQLRQEAMEYRQLLFSNLANENKPTINPDSLARLIASNQQQIEMVTYRHFAQVKLLCTEQQTQEFDEIIGEVIKKMNPGPHPPPGDRPGPPEGQGPPPGPPPPDGPPKP